ncbi:MAG: hypothetical protein H7311_07135 [Ramlibacter sp.]|nr:hypothetical protein [Cryobacterium sp.]
MTTPMDSVDDAKEDAAIIGVIRRMQSRFHGTDPAHVQDVVRGHHRHLNTARVRTYVPVLVEPASRDPLSTTSQPPSPVGPR